MIDSVNWQSARSRQRRRAAALMICTVLAGLVFAGSLAAIAMAMAGTAAVRIGSAPDSALGEQVLVSSQGRTLYALSPESASHLLCKSGACLKLWSPLTLASPKTKIKAGSGVQGHFGILRRSDGMLQVTFRGLPLYRYSGDHARGEANGQGIKSFGGTWHVLSASSAVSKTPVAPAPAPW